MLTREKERQEKAKAYYTEHYMIIYANNLRQLNTVGDGEPVHPIAVRENGEYVIPRSMQHTSSIVHGPLNFPQFDFHSLRHTHATMSAENDAPPKYLQDRMGHKNLEITMKFYLHLTEKMKEKGAGVLRKMYPLPQEKIED
ncbi:MAG: tyrosine-type recombinase/integrase [Oscillospiraceae bacterium]|nr:tyrosine-type recombinase/integrase [Oscillospiraceae bacterium]